MAQQEKREALVDEQCMSGLGWWLFFLLMADSCLGYAGLCITHYYLSSTERFLHDKKDSSKVYQ